MKTIEIRDANYVVGKSGMRLSANNGATVVEFYQGDGIRISNKGGYPVIEFRVSGKDLQVKVETKADLKNLLERVHHETEFKTESLDLMEAIARDSRDLPTEKLVDAFSESFNLDTGRLNTSIKVTKRVADLNVESKAKLLSSAKCIFSEADESALVSITDAEDQDLADDDDKDEDENKQESSRRKIKENDDENDDNKDDVKEDTDKDEDDDNKDDDKMESRRKVRKSK